MGLPLTWITLSLLHIYYVWMAEQEFEKKRSAADVIKHIVLRGVSKLNPVHIAKHRPFRICGDDLIGIWPKAYTEIYQKVVIQHNGKFSAGKHYRSKRFGVFTEIMFEVGKVKSTHIVKRHRYSRPIDFPVLGEPHTFYDKAVKAKRMA
jgi:hypothetical protein